MKIVAPFPGSSRLVSTSERLSQFHGKAVSRKPQRPQESCTLLVGNKHMALHLFRHTFPSSISTFVGRDFAICVSTCRSTTGMLKWVRNMFVKHTSNLQGATGLKDSACEYYALTHGAAHGLGLKAHMADLGFARVLESFQ